MSESDLIYRQDAIDAMNEVYCHIEMIKKRPVNKIEQAMYLDMIGAVRSVPSAQQWIPCSDRLPEDGMKIIVQYGDGSLGVIERVRLKIWNLINSPYAKVVAWMPAPQPWKGEKDEYTN